MLLHDTFDYSARENLTAEFAVQGTRRVSYAEVQAIANRIANALVAKGLVPGDRFALLSRNSIDHALWYYVCSKAGVVPVPLNFRLAPVRGERATVKHWIALGTDVRGWERFDALVAAQPPSAPAHRGTPDDDVPLALALSPELTESPLSDEKPSLHGLCSDSLCPARRI